VDIQRQCEDRFTLRIWCSANKCRNYCNSLSGRIYNKAL